MPLFSSYARSPAAGWAGYALGVHDTDPRIALVRADLGRMPPTTIILAEINEQLPRTYGADRFQTVVDAAIRLVDPRYPSRAVTWMSTPFSARDTGQPSLVCCAMRCDRAATTSR